MNFYKFKGILPLVIKHLHTAFLPLLYGIFTGFRQLIYKLLTIEVYSGLPRMWISETTKCYGKAGKWLPKSSGKGMKKAKPPNKILLAAPQHQGYEKVIFPFM